MGVYYTICRKTGDFLPHEYADGDFVKGIRSGLPTGTYRTIDGKNVRINESFSVPTHVGSDGMSPTLNPADGKMYDSKTKYHQALAAKGCHVTEDGESYKRPSEPVGDFNVRKELTSATKQVLSRRNT